MNIQVFNTPHAVGAALNANAARQANHEKSVAKVGEHSRKAMGILMGLFHPDCNAHRSLTAWYAEALPGLEEGRTLISVTHL